MAAQNKPADAGVKPPTPHGTPPSTDEGVPAQQPPPSRLEPEKDLFTWKAPARPFKRRDRQFWVTIISIAGIFGFILFLIEGVMPVVLIISIIFLFYVLSTVEPEDIEYKLTNRGVKIAGRTTDWNLLTRFWFSNRFDSDLLIFEMITIPGRLELVIKSSDRNEIRKAASQYLIEEEAPPSGLDRAANWFAQKLPGNS